MVTKSSSSSSEGSSSNTTAIVVGVVVGVLGTCLLAGLVFAYYKHSQNKLVVQQVRNEDLDGTIKPSEMESPNKGQLPGQSALPIHAERTVPLSNQV